MRLKLRKTLTFAILIALVIALHDFTVPHGRGLAARGAIFLIDEYRAHISPRLSGKVTCRFTPSCSAYGREAIRKHGFGVGSAKAAWRIARCGPWTKMGTSDPP
ncbi:MAG TPA: membrane protein insertion efficiency factor YidD [Thermoanaerobaculia bacterium]|nr:membrane protein insertion efficiency factor YidD [Thermoanaerobaculia bacterium]